MTDYEFRDGFPYHAVDAAEGYVIRDCNVSRIEDGKETGCWDCFCNSAPVPATYPAAWVRQFWGDLRAAPCFELRADQWSTDYYSILGGMLVRWEENRQQGADYLYRSQSLAAALQDPSLPEPAKSWLRQALT